MEVKGVQGCSFVAGEKGVPLRECDTMTLRSTTVMAKEIQEDGMEEQLYSGTGNSGWLRYDDEV